MLSQEDRDKRATSLKAADQLLRGESYTYADLLAVLEASDSADLTELLREAGVITDPEYATLDEETGVIRLFLSITDGNPMLVEAVIKSLNPEHFVALDPTAEIHADFDDDFVDETREASLRAYGS